MPRPRPGGRRGLTVLLSLLAFQCMLLLLLRLPPSAVHALTLAVNNVTDSTDGRCTPTDDGSACNLRAGIAYCLQDAPAQNVTVCTLQLVNGTHVLVEGAMSVSGSAVDILVVGRGREATVVSGIANGARWLYVDAVSHTLLITRLTVSGFSDTSGGAVYARESTDLRFNDVLFQANRATDTNGGAVLLDEGNDNAQFYNVTFHKNVALSEKGGGVALQQYNRNVSFQGCEWRSNNATGRGGGIHLEEYNHGTTFANCLLIENHSNNEGGGLRVHRSNNALYVRNTLFLKNRAPCNGGGVSLGYENGNATMVHSMFVHNIVSGCENAGYGGGLHLDTAHLNATFVNVTWEGNRAVNGAGTAITQDNHGTRFSACIWVDNACETAGGGVLVDDSNDNVSFVGCSFEANTAKCRGAGVSLEQDNVRPEFRQCRWVANELTNTDECADGDPVGAGVSIVSGNTDGHFTNCSWRDHAGATYGGAVFVGADNAGMAIASCNLETNGVTDGGKGGAIFMNSDNAQVSAIDCVFDSNHAPFGRGGALYVFERNHNLTVALSTFVANSAGESGGGVHLDSDNKGCVFDNDTFQGNRATNGPGGALYVESENHALLCRSSTFTNNTATEAGLAVYLNTANEHSRMENCTWAHHGSDVTTTEDDAVNTRAVVYLSTQNRRAQFVQCVWADNEVAGALVVDDSNDYLSMVDCDFRRNSLDTGDGAAVYLKQNNGWFLAVNCLWSQNEVHDGSGGAVAMQYGNDNASIVSSRFEFNTASNGNAGGFFADDSNTDLSLDDCTWYSNSCAGIGGAVVLNKHNIDATVAGNVFVQNAAANDGGGLTIYSSNVVVLRSNTFWTNQANDDGGAFSVFFNNTVTIDSVIATRNSAVDEGGAVYVTWQNHQVRFENCTFAQNEADGNGGGVSIGTENVGVTFAGCVFDSNYCSFDGAGVFLDHDNHEVSLLNVTLAQNVADGYGGGVSIGTENVGVIFTDSVLDSNICTFDGAGVFMDHDNHDISLLNVTVRSNIAGRSGAGVHSSYQNSDILLNGSLFFNNSAANGEGGGLSMEQEIVGMRVNSSVFRSNRAMRAGGAVYLGSDNSGFHVSRTIFTGCESDTGGAIYVETQNDEISLSGCEFTYNQASEGGAVYVGQRNTALQFSDCVAEWNRALTSGGFLYLRSQLDGLTIRRCTMVYNTAVTGNGGAIVSQALTTNAIVSASLVQSNRAVSGAFSLGVRDHWRIQGTVFRNNIADLVGGAIDFLGTELLLVEDSVFENNSASTGGAISAIGASPTLLSFVNFYNSTFTNNSADDIGGAGYFGDLYLWVGGCTFRNHSALAFGGALVLNDVLGGFFTPDPPSSLLDRLNSSVGQEATQWFNDLTGANGGTTFLGNRAHIGASLYLTGSHDVLLTNVLCSGGSAQYGGCMVAFGSRVALNSSIFQNSSAQVGGAVFVKGSSSLNLSACSFQNNVASQAAGAIWMGPQLAAGSVIAHSNFTGCVAGLNGGAAYVLSRNVTFLACTIRDNQALTGGGGGVFWDPEFCGNDGEVALISTNISSNVAVYGSELATPLYTLECPDTIDALSGTVTGSIEVLARDWYGHIVKGGDINDAGVVELTLAGGPNCDNPSLAGPTLASFVAGVASFDSMTFTCAPGSAFDITFETSGEHLLTDDVLDDDSVFANFESFSTASHVSLQPCHLGEYVSGDVCFVCGNDEYTWDSNATQCEPCLQHSTCPAENGWEVDVQKGYWRQANDSTKVRWCPGGTQSCTGGSDPPTQCGTGSGGPLCLVCDDGYFQSSTFSHCRLCTSMNRYAPVIGVGVLVFASVAAVLYVRWAHPEMKDRVKEVFQRSSFRTHWKLTFAFWQLATQFQYLYAVAYPGLFEASANSLSITNVSFRAFFAPQCTFGSDEAFYPSLVLQTLGAIGFFLVGVVFNAVRAFFSADPEQKRLHSNAGLLWALFSSYAVFPGTSTTIMSSFFCDSDFEGDQSYLRADYSCSCRSDRYHAYRIYAWLMAIIIPGGIISLYFVILYRNRERISPRLPFPATAADANDLPAAVASHCNVQTKGIKQLTRDLQEETRALLTVAHSSSRMSHQRLVAEMRNELQHRIRCADKELSKFAFLFEAYRCRLWYMEIIECARRLLLSSVIIFFGSNTEKQLVAALFFCAFFILLYSFLQPFMQRMANQVMIATLWCTLLLLFLTLLIYERIIASSSAVGVLMVLLLVVGPFTPLLFAACLADRCAESPGYSKVPGVGDKEERPDTERSRWSLWRKGRASSRTIALQTIKYMAGIRDSEDALAQPEEYRASVSAAGDDAIVDTWNPVSEKREEHEL